MPASSSDLPPVRPRARGTRTSLLESRKLRLRDRSLPLPADGGGRPAAFAVERHGDVFVVFRSRVGALSALTAPEYVAFQVFMAAEGDRSALVRYYVQMGMPQPGAQLEADAFADRLVDDGWTRTDPPLDALPPLRAVQLTVTRYCDRCCPYCFQGLADRRDTEMPLESVRLVLDRIRAVNPGAFLVLSGGEPFTHSRIHDILDTVDQQGFAFSVLSNGSFLDEGAARHLGRLRGFRAIQISLDGATAAVHELTRGRGHFPKVMAALHWIFACGLPFKLAPTVHAGNLHELSAVADMAVSHGGWFTPNALQELPHAGLDYTALLVDPDEAMRALAAVDEHLLAQFGAETLGTLRARYSGTDPDFACGTHVRNATFVCPMARQFVDVDWNGDVYPCPLAKAPELRIGNVFAEDFAAVFDRAEERGIRVMSYEIEKCSTCKFVSNCAGGCRANAYFSHGTLQREDTYCRTQYALRLRKLLSRAGGA